MSEPQTTLVYKGITYPFYKTNRGQFDFENAGFITEDISKGKMSTMLALIFFNLRDCAKRSGMELSDSFEQFIDFSDTDITDVFIRLSEIREKDKKAVEQAKKNSPIKK